MVIVEVKYSSKCNEEWEEESLDIVVVNAAEGEDNLDVNCMFGIWSEEVTLAMFSNLLWNFLRLVSFLEFRDNPIWLTQSPFSPFSHVVEWKPQSLCFI